MHCIAVYCTALQRYRRSVGGRAEDWIETEPKVGALLLLLPLIKGLLSCLKISSKKYNNSDAIRPDDILFLGWLVNKTMPGWETALNVFLLLSGHVRGEYEIGLVGLNANMNLSGTVWGVVLWVRNDWLFYGDDETGSEKCSRPW